MVVEKLLTYGRAGAAVMYIATLVEDATCFDETLAVRALTSVLDSESEVQTLDAYHTANLIKRLQKSNVVANDDLVRIEWNFLPWLDRFSFASPITLEKRLASDPDFFTEVVALVYRSEKDTDDYTEELDPKKRHLAQNAFKLLTEWELCPGIEEDGTLDVDVFNSWITKARQVTEQAGYRAVAQRQIGHLLTNAPPDPEGLWIHEAVAKVLNHRDTSDMRSGFASGLLNQRGVHGFSHGKEERDLAELNRGKANALDLKAFTRLATTMREIAEQYDRQAELDEQRDPFDR